MSAERLHSREQPEALIGKSVLEVVCLLPTLPLFTRLNLAYPEINFHLVKYRIGRFEYRLYGLPDWPYYQLDEIDRPDTPLPPVKAIQGEKIDPKKLDFYLEPEWAIGITSRVSFTPKDSSQIKAHIPMMDFDYRAEEFNDEQAMWAIEEKLQNEAEMRRGLIIKSSRKLGHFHFLGNSLLSNEQFLTFLGVCLLMRDKKLRPLADSRYIGHALTARMRDFINLGDYDERHGPYLIYDGMESFQEYPGYPDVFTTLRIKSNKPDLLEPRVIDVFHSPFFN